jgi:hypothetical protein
MFRDMYCAFFLVTKHLFAPSLIINVPFRDLKESLQELPVITAGLWIRIGSGFRDFVDPDPGARKQRNFSGKNALFSYLKKNFTTEKI